MMISNAQGGYLSESLKFKSVMEGCPVSFEMMGNGGFPARLVRIRMAEGYVHAESSGLVVKKDKGDSSIFMYRDDHFYSPKGGELADRNGCLGLIPVDENRPVRSPPLKGVLGVLPALVRNGLAKIGNSSRLLDPVRELVHNSPHERISNLFEVNSPLFRKILEDPAVHDLLRKIYPQGYHCATFSSNTARPGVDKRFWHCDYPYHNMPRPYPERTLGIQVIWMLDDFTLENGATYYVPGSHKTRQWPDPDKISDDSRRRLTGKKGDVVMFSGKLWHSVGLNSTRSPRSALLANFVPLDVPAKDDIASQAPGQMVKDGKVVFV